MDLSKQKHKLKMVCWYDPHQLFLTAIDVIISAVFGRHADYRIIEALGSQEIKPYDYSAQSTNKDFWLDFTADVGDGWNSTYHIAYLISQPELCVKDPEGILHKTQRGSILIFGGDAVYPVASRLQYQERLIEPYTAALKCTSPPHPHLFAIPGNHDWYDSLVAFTRLFCSKRWFAGWQTQQERSYFAIKLPHHWWLIGTDIQLGSDIDDGQVNYFKKIAKNMEENDKVILCTAEPDWILTKMYGKKDPIYNESNLEFLEQNIFKKRISLYLAGDIHHYRRHEGPSKTQKIVAGGGGAFLHPTHGQDVTVLDNEFILKKSFPEENISKKLCFKNFAFLFFNPWFGMVTGFLYLMTAWCAQSALGVVKFNDLFSKIVNTLLKAPFGTLWVILVFLGFILFTDTHSTVYRIVAGLLHGAAHMMSAFILGFLWIYFAIWMGFAEGSTAQLLIAAGLIFISGWIMGAFIMGVYLFISLNVFGRHSNEAFSSLAIQDWKNFLRIKIDTQGNMTLYPIGIKRVARKWKRKNSDGFISEWLIDDMKASAPELIEAPIQMASMQINSLAETK